jgi:glycosyltransferase involved in cell wall biosynthesis
MSGPLSIVHTEASTGWGGQEIRILTEAAGFIARGHRVTVYATPGSRILHEAPRFAVPAVALPIGTKQPRGVAALVGAFRTSPVDIVNTHSSTDTWLAALACRWLRVRDRPRPVLVRTRHVSVPVPNNRTTRWLYRKAATRVVTTGEALRENLIREIGIDPARIDSVPTGIDATRFAPGDQLHARTLLDLPKAKPVVGIVATLRSWKGHRYLLDALAKLKHRNTILAIVGDGPQREVLEAQAEGLRVTDRVVFAGQQNDVVPWLHALDAFVLPSYAHEGVPQALLQAMFAGLACVTTDAGAIPEIARHGETAHIVERQNADALARGIDRVLADSNYAADLGNNARRLVQARYGLDAMLSRMEGIFRQALTDAQDKR